MAKTSRKTAKKVLPTKEETTEEKTVPVMEKEVEAATTEEPTTEQKLKEVRKKIEKLSDRISKEQQKVSEWEKEDERLVSVENAKYEKRKKQLTEDMEKLEKRHETRLSNIFKWWKGYGINHKEKKIVPMQNKLERLQKEADKLAKAAK